MYKCKKREVRGKKLEVLLIIYLLLFTSSLLPQVRIEQLLSYEDTTEALRTKNIIPIDAYWYLKAGGTFHGLVSQATTDGATIIISDTITTTMDYIPSSINLDFTNEGYLTKPSGPLIVLGSVTAPKRKIFSSNINLSESRVNIVYPEWYGAVPDGYTNSATALQNTFLLAKNKIISMDGHYAANDSISVDYQEFSSVDIVTTPNTQITFTVAAADYSYYSTHGIMSFRNGSRLLVQGLKIILQNDDRITQSDNGLVITDFKEAVLENVDIRGAGYNGIYSGGNSSFAAINCVSDSNMFAGILFRETNQITITGGSYSYNGVVGSFGGDPNYVSGYGVALSTRWGDITTLGNKNVSIKFAKIWYNYRTAITGHGGISQNYSDNHIKGFGLAAITPINEGGASGYESYNYNTIIHHNIIEQDSAWCVSHGFKPERVIWAGAYYDVTNPTGSLTISNNIISHAGWYSGSGNGGMYAPIYVLVNYPGYGSYINSATIVNNVITDLYNPRDGCIVVAGGEYSTSDNPTNVLIANNTGIGTGTYGIVVLRGKHVIIDNNSMIGFNNTVYSGVPFTGFNNRKNGFPVANYGTSKGYFDFYKRGGYGEYTYMTTDSTAVLKLLSVITDKKNYSDGGAIVKVDIDAATYYPRYSASFSGIALAGFVSGSDSTIISTGDTLQKMYNTPEYLAEEGIAKPVLTWGQTGSDTTRRHLYLTLPNPYVYWNIAVKFMGYSPSLLQDSLAYEELSAANRWNGTKDNGTRAWRDHTKDIPHVARTALDSVLHAYDSLAVHRDSISLFSTRLFALGDSIKTHRDSIDALRDRKVDGDASSIDNSFARFDGTTGKQIQDSPQATMTDAGNITVTHATDSLITRFQGASNTQFSKFYLSHISAGDGGYKYNSNTNILDVFAYDDIIFRTGSIGGWIGTERMRIDAATGQTQITGFKLGSSTTSGYVLTADANGVGTWQANSPSMPSDVLRDADFSAGNGLMLKVSEGSYDVVTNNASNWNTAYGWGNHASAGYLAKTDSTTLHYVKLWQGTTAYGWGNHASANYIADADFSAGNGLMVKVGAGSYDVVTNNASNWNTAYGWGNHASAGYLTGNQSITLSGDVSGSGSTSITTTVADDSHNHSGSTISGLSTSDFTSTNLSNWTNDLVTDFYPYITTGGSATNRTITIKTKKMNDGELSSNYVLVHWWLSTQDYQQPPSSTAPNGAVVAAEVSTGNELGAENITAINHAVSNSDETVVITLTCSGSTTTTWYLMAEVQGRVYSTSFTLQDFD